MELTSQEIKYKRIAITSLVAIVAVLPVSLSGVISTAITFILVLLSLSGVGGGYFFLKSSIEKRGTKGELESFNLFSQKLSLYLGFVGFSMLSLPLCYAYFIELPSISTMATFIITGLAFMSVSDADLTTKE